jgi:hypothetical protein
MHAALEAAFDHAVRVQAVLTTAHGHPESPRWVALLEQSPP